MGVVYVMYALSEINKNNSSGDLLNCAKSLIRAYVRR